MTLRFYNTLTRKKEAFKPIHGNSVGLYTCGPTVYDYAHIGNLRSYIFADLLKRWLIVKGFSVKHVMNITDVGHLISDADSGEDKMELGAKREHKTAWQIAEMYTNEFLNDLEKLKIEKPDIICKATDHIQEMIVLVKQLEEKGFTYRTEDGIYFDTAKFNERDLQVGHDTNSSQVSHDTNSSFPCKDIKDVFEVSKSNCSLQISEKSHDRYGKLALLDVEGMKAGARVEMGNKKNPTDFALWKFSLGKKRDMEWDSPFGKGFPGWHIECSAMSMKYLGEHFDIHTGGIDHVNVHHPNEIAQSEAATGKKFVNFWLHHEHILVNNEKLSKSLKNFILLKELEAKGYEPLLLRYFYLSGHYKSQINFTYDVLDQARQSVEGIRDFAAKIMFLLDNYFSDKADAYAINSYSVSQNSHDINSKSLCDSHDILSEKIDRHVVDFKLAMDDDLNSSSALASFHEMMNDVNRAIDGKKIDRLVLEKAVHFIELFNRVFDIIDFSKLVEKNRISDGDREFVREREQFRKDRKFKEADEIRDILKNHGILLEDTPYGTRWIRK
ncbi:MAG: cysteine--tRNA ligase [Candidatus Aenigmatarchaeota archaeon]